MESEAKSHREFLKGRGIKMSMQIENHIIVIIIATGAGGGCTLAYKLAPSTKRRRTFERSYYVARGASIHGSFKRKGRFAELMANVPVHVILTRAALVGAASYGLESLREGS